MATLPQIRYIPIAEVAAFSERPVTKIRTDEDVDYWKTTRGYQDYGLFLRRLNESVVDHYLPWTGLAPSPVGFYSTSNEPFSPNLGSCCRECAP